MRRLSMRTKRKKSERNSESETEENGVESLKRNDMSDSDINVDENSEKGKENESDENEDLNNTPNRKSVGKKKRLPRTRHSEEQKTLSQTNSKQTPKMKKQLEDADDMKTNTDQENGAVNKRGANKKRKKDEQKTSPTSTRGAVSGEEEYEVEKIVGRRTIKGRRQFLIRWKGYGEESDTWEQEKDLNCPKLIENFLLDDNETDETISEKAAKPIKAKSVKADKKKEMKKSKYNKRQSNLTEEEEELEIVDTLIKNDENQKEFEVDKIIEVHFRKNKKREFLIRWKGFTAADDTWEPEENLNCPDLINKFMDKVEKAKTTEMRELRSNPAHTKRYTLSTHDSGRRLSRRHIDKQRIKK
ncbi:PREDICTED: chromodomain-helicase-DNA-binding protein 1-like isoform X2 [Polistes canadensis]|uniref:chromodomain-helicase-DNA-binding protein 1-like isoform X2 n=1 Tax=Polistes canadensis TaxID=91411 RepID=UPI000718BD1B|nr:PREDICTED: chromodomain-helicase-DNA-binding protein 1-like isoform X2 [Polistes canadensis]